jgi:hypothetical protein
LHSEIEERVASIHRAAEKGYLLGNPEALREHVSASGSFSV